MDYKRSVANEDGMPDAKIAAFWTVITAATTQRYMHLSPAPTEDAIRLLDGRLVDLKVAQNVET